MSGPKDIGSISEIDIRPAFKPLPPFAEKLEQENGGTNPAGDQADAESLLEKMILGACTSDELLQMPITPRAKLLDDWFREGDLGFIFGFRGLGKTFFAYSLARAISQGGRFGPWESEQSAKVLYVDGEMPQELMKNRTQGLQAGSPNLVVINHEILFERTNVVLNLSRIETQRAITEFCLRQGVKVMFLDNMSTLLSGVKENDSDSWEKMNGWLLDLRRRQIAVVVIHHSGRNGEMRGTSRREDNAFWVLKLDRKSDAASDRGGGPCFISMFTKQRNSPVDPPAYEWSFRPEEGTGKVLISYKKAVAEDIVLEWVRNGLTSCDEIASEMHVSKGTVSKLATKLIERKKLTKNGRQYALPENEENDG
jgi:DNA-binding CsgD family transcriptional regulator